MEMILLNREPSGIKEMEREREEMALRVIYRGTVGSLGGSISISPNPIRSLLAFRKGEENKDEKREVCEPGRLYGESGNQRTVTALAHFSSICVRTPHT